jgi:hypothetical protein
LVDDIETRRRIAEQPFDRAELDGVGHGRGAVGIDIVDIGRARYRRA